MCVECFVLNDLFAFKMLKASGFKEGIICGWVRTFHTHIKSTVIANGQASQWFPIYRGCRQGDPIYPYLSILFVEILGITIREKNAIYKVFSLTILNTSFHNMQMIQSFF